MAVTLRQSGVRDIDGRNDESALYRLCNHSSPAGAPGEGTGSMDLVHGNIFVLPGLL